MKFKLNFGSLHTYTERLFIWEIDKEELVFNIFLYENRENEVLLYLLIL